MIYGTKELEYEAKEALDKILESQNRIVSLLDRILFVLIKIEQAQKEEAPQQLDTEMTNGLD